MNVPLCPHGVSGAHLVPAQSRVAEEPKCERENVTLKTDVREKPPISNCAEPALAVSTQLDIF